MPTRLKHRWSLGHNYLAGITAGDWWRLLRRHRFGVDAAYWHRAAFITLTSTLNSIHHRRESRLYDSEIKQIDLPPPLFVLGHWRSGTTHLHNLLARDSEQFAFANTYQVVNPHTFLTTEHVNTRRFAWMVPEKRPMDNVALNFQTPQEDEFAPCLMSLRSLYLGISFPRSEEEYLRYLTFRNVPENEVDEWSTAFVWFLKKLTFKYRRPLVLKSPAHTGRIRLLLELFPDARFVHIHRNPYDVFQSFRYYFDTAVWHSYLQRPDRSLVDERILQRYNLLYEAFFEDRSMIPEGRFHEMPYADLERDPIGEMEKLYRCLNLDGFERFRPKLRQYVNSLSEYRKNEYAELESPARQSVAKSWRRTFDEWNYTI